MNILFVSGLSGNLSVGPSYSVPAQIKAQSKIDNVFWLNVTDSFREEWKELGIPYLYGSKYKKITLKEIVDTFTMPDIVFFEGCYNYPFFNLAYEIQSKSIPYLLVPRSQLTEGAQRNKALKKKIMNLLYFNRFINKATAIQYLTQSEAIESSKWKPQKFIIPNGIEQREYSPRDNSHKASISIVYVGRIDIFQKGLDLFVEACSRIVDVLQENRVSVTLYGQATPGDREKLQSLISSCHMGDIISLEEPVFGEKKFSILKNTDLFVMTSRFEGLPMGLIEALSFGCPCAVTSGTNMAFDILDAGAGWILPDDTEGMAAVLKNAICELMSTYKEKSRMAYELSLKYTWDDIALQTQNICKEII